MTKSDKIGALYAAAMTVYFLVSGLSMLFDVPTKLVRINLKAVNADGEIAFILIYCGLMVGIGAANIILWRLSKTWLYPAVLSTVIVASFILFRLVGSYMVGTVSESQASFLVIELLELSLGCLIIWRCGLIKRRSS